MVTYKRRPDTWTALVVHIFGAYMSSYQCPDVRIFLPAASSAPLNIVVFAQHDQCQVPFFSLRSNKKHPVPKTLRLQVRRLANSPICHAYSSLEQKSVARMNALWRHGDFHRLASFFVSVISLRRNRNRNKERSSSQQLFCQRLHNCGLNYDEDGLSITTID